MANHMYGKSYKMNNLGGPGSVKANQALGKAAVWLS